MLPVVAHEGSIWSASRLVARPDAASILPEIDADDVRAVVPDLDLWDMWPLQEEDGSTAVIDGATWWFFLATPKFADPEERHEAARIRLTTFDGLTWTDRGDLLPGGFGPGSREWSGSAVRNADGNTLTLYYTAAGYREGGPRFGQRIHATVGQIDRASPGAGGWTAPQEVFCADGRWYAAADQGEPVRGMIRGFRDPGYFRDPADDRVYVTFTGSSGQHDEEYDGVIGAARHDDDGWTLLPPLVSAVGVNKELERAHVVHHQGRYYLFWSTHGARFAPPIKSPTGLYGMVADTMAGPWRPLNGSGLVAANPPQEPQQGYCWWVTKELRVLSFVNYWGLQGRTLGGDAALARAQFGGTVAPIFRLHLDGELAVPVF